MFWGTKKLKEIREGLPPLGGARGSAAVRVRAQETAAPAPAAASAAAAAAVVGALGELWFLGWAGVIC